MLGTDAAVLARVQAAVVLFGVEDSQLVVGLHRQGAGSVDAFAFPSLPLTPDSTVTELAHDLATKLVRNRTSPPRLIGAHSVGPDESEPQVLISHAVICSGSPPVPRYRDITFGEVMPLRKAWPEFLKPHDEVLQEALGWLFREVQDHPVVADMCGPRFTIADLRKAYEQVWDVELDPANFHKQVTRSGLGFVRKVEDFAGKGPGKPAALFEPGPAEVLNPPVRPRHGKRELPSLRVWGRDRHGRLDQLPKDR